MGPGQHIHLRNDGGTHKLCVRAHCHAPPTAMHRPLPCTAQVDTQNVFTLSQASCEGREAPKPPFHTLLELGFQMQRRCASVLSLPV